MEAAAVNFGGDHVAGFEAGWSEGQSSQVPAQVEKHLDSLDFSQAGTLLLGSSNLTGRYWSGTVFLWKNPSDAPNVETCITGIETETGVCDTRFITNDTCVVGQDSGTVQSFMLCQTEDEKQVPFFQTVHTATEHDDAVTSLDINSDTTLLVTGGADACIKVWDIGEMNAVSSYRPAHSDVITAVNYHPTQQDVFASCSHDGTVVVWDARRPRPAICITGDTVDRPSCVVWQPGKTCTIAIGSSTGQINVRDIRKHVGPVKGCAGHDRPIHRLKFAPHNDNWLASCADDCNVVVTDFTENTPVLLYKDSQHKDFIRGLAWEPSTHQLYTCGWDKRVIAHTV